MGHPSINRFWFFLLSVGLVIVSFALISFVAFYSRKRLSLDFRMGLAACVSFFLGCLKVLVDSVKAPNCQVWGNLSSQNDCGFDVWDIFLTLDGTLTGLVLLLSLEVIYRHYFSRRSRARQDDPCDATEAETIIEDGEADEGNNNLSFQEDDYCQHDVPLTVNSSFETTASTVVLDSSFEGTEATPVYAERVVTETLTTTS